MPAIEKASRFEDLRHHLGSIPFEYRYTAGVAGQRFLEALKEGKLLASKCGGCGARHLPPRLYCEKCGGKTSGWIEVKGEGRVYSYAVTRRPAEGAALKRPVIYALMRFDGVDGGLLHRLRGVSPRDVRMGMPVRPVFASKRRGSILDIRCFEPV